MAARFGSVGVMLAVLLAAQPAQAWEIVVDLPSLERTNQRYIDDNCIPMERTSWRGPAQLASLSYVNIAPRCARSDKLPVDINELARDELSSDSFSKFGPTRRRTTRRGWAFDTMRFEATAEGETMDCVWAASQFRRTGLIYGIYCANGLDEPAILTFLNALGVK